MKLTTGCTTKLNDADKEVIRNIVRDELQKQKKTTTFTISEIADLISEIELPDEHLAEVEALQLELLEQGFGDGGFDDFPYDGVMFLYVKNGNS